MLPTFSTVGTQPVGHVEGDAQKKPAHMPVPRKLFAEFVGTYFAVLVTAGIEVVAVLKPGEIDRTVKAAAPSLVAAAMIYALGDLSGAHFNPAVTLVFAVRRDFPKSLVVPYWIAQFGGAICAGLTLRSLFGTVRDVGISKLDGVTGGRGFVIEILITTLLVVISLNAAHEHSLIGTQAAIAVASTMAACRMIAGPLTSASMNPARSVGPAVASGVFTDLWVFVAGPVVGALAALAIVVALRPHRNRDEHEAAQGE
ncbi:MAG: aquaporin [Ilumatobacteraceae bacterium]